MALGRRRKQQNRDPFEHLADERREAESDSPWFLAPDDGPELDVQAGISSNLRDDPEHSEQGDPDGGSEPAPEQGRS